MCKCLETVIHVDVYVGGAIELNVWVSTGGGRSSRGGASWGIVGLCGCLFIRVGFSTWGLSGCWTMLGSVLTASEKSSSIAELGDWDRASETMLSLFTVFSITAPISVSKGVCSSLNECLNTWDGTIELCFWKWRRIWQTYVMQLVIYDWDKRKMTQW